MFALVWGVIRLRKWLTEQKWHLDGRFSARARRKDGDGDVEMNRVLK